MAHPLRRHRLSFPAARLDVAVNDTVVAIVSAFFVMGIVVGIIAVAALPVLRAGRRRDHGDPGGRPRWPGDGDNDFSGG